MELSQLTAISPIDGRYRNKLSELGSYFSEFALIRCRVMVEIKYFVALCRIQLPQLAVVDRKKLLLLDDIVTHFSIEDAEQIKQIESTTNHDVKAVEYFLKDKFDSYGLSEYKEFIHLGLTSQDINNTAFPYLLKQAIKEVYRPVLGKLIQSLIQLAEVCEKIPMLARTHGQPASPTRLGKEIGVFIERINIQLGQQALIPSSAKFGGATGNFNAHYVAYPDVNWKKFADAFVNSVLELERSQTTTQIEHYDNMAALFDSMSRINTILIDLCRDIWTYISMDYFKQKITKGEIGSSAMPHKVNPIDFENAEGNLGLANSIFGHLSAKLPISRLQRDLTDSTVMRNIGVPVSHTILAFHSLLKGLSKLIVNEKKIREDLEDNWNVVAEAIQTILRREGYPKPYEALKELTRTHSKIDEKSIKQFVNQLNISKKVKKEMLAITPMNFIGK